MNVSGRRVWLAPSVLGACVLLCIDTARADAPPRMAGDIVCPSAAPGRVVCSVALRAETERLVWADVLVTKTPTFAKPLRARIGFPERTEHSERSAVIPLALVAIGVGEGAIEVLGRAVLCEPQRRGACAARTLRLSGIVRVESGETR